MRNAQRRDPHDWHYAYGLAVTQALAGQDPRPAAAQALRLNPLEPQAISLARRLSSNSPAAPAGGGGALAHPVRLTTRGGPEPASREFACGGA